MKKALVVATTGGFLTQFESGNAELLKALGYKVSFAANYHYSTYGVTHKPADTNDISIHQISLTREPWHILKNLQAISWLRQFIQKESIDLVICHNPMGGAAGRLAGRFLKEKEKPYVIYMAHGFHFYRGAPRKNWVLYHTVEKLLAHMTDHLLTINREDYAAAGRFRLRPNGKVAYIPGVGLDMEKFSIHREWEGEVRRELGIPENAFHIVSAAELSVNKNLAAIIRSIAAIDNEDLYYSICGIGEEKENLENLIRNLHLERRVHLLGYRYDMERILQTADCFAAPSQREGLGMAALEALACGVPLLAADNRGTREYAVNGINSIVCRSGSVQEYTLAIQKLMEDASFRKQLAARARESAEPFRKEESEKQMRQIYTHADSVINKRKEALIA